MLLGDFFFLRTKHDGRGEEALEARSPYIGALEARSPKVLLGEARGPYIGALGDEFRRLPRGSVITPLMGFSSVSNPLVLKAPRNKGRQTEGYP